jgi:hypothetical protein
MANDLSSHLGQAKPLGDIARNRNLEADFKSNRLTWARVIQPYGINGETHEVDPSRAAVLRWHGGFNFLPLDLRDVGTLRTYIGAFRSGRKFNGLVLKGNNEIFAHALFERNSGCLNSISMPRSDALSHKRKEEKIAEAYETWLEETLRELCEEETAIIVNGSDAPFALPFLLSRGFQILAPHKNLGLAFAMPQACKVIIEHQEVSLGNIKLAGGNIARVIDEQGPLQANFFIFLDLDGSFVVLEGPAGKKLPRTSRQLSKPEKSLIGKFRSLGKQKDQFLELINEGEDSNSHLR